MRKTLISIGTLVVIIVVIAIFSPLVIGFYVQKNAQVLIKNSYLSPKVSLQLLQFKRGWFVSRAKLKVNIHLDPALYKTDKTVNQGYQFINTVNIYNGPFIFYRDHHGKNKFVFALATLTNNVNKAVMKFHDISIWHFNNHIISHFHSPLFKHHFAHNDLSIDLKQLRGTSTYQLKNGHLSTITQIKQGVITTSHQRAKHSHNTLIQFDDLQSQFGVNTNDTPWYLYGRSNIRIKKLRISSNDLSPIELNQIIISSQANKHKNNISARVQFHVATLNINNNTYGPLNLALNISKLNTQAYIALQKQIIAIQRQQSFNDKSELHGLNSAFMQLLSYGLNVNLQQFRLSTPSGTIELSAQISAPNLNGQINPIATLFESQVALNLQLPKVWVHNLFDDFYKTIINKMDKPKNPQQKPVNNSKDLANNLIQHWIQNHMLIQRGHNLILKLNLDNGRLLINGRPPQFDMQDLTPPITPAKLPHKTGVAKPSGKP